MNQNMVSCFCDTSRNKLRSSSLHPCCFSLCCCAASKPPTATPEGFMHSWQPEHWSCKLHDAVLLQAPRPQSPIRPNGDKSYRVISFSCSRVPNWKPNATTAAPKGHQFNDDKPCKVVNLLPHCQSPTVSQLYCGCWMMLEGKNHFKTKCYAVSLRNCFILQHKRQVILLPS